MLSVVESFLILYDGLVRTCDDLVRSAYVMDMVGIVESCAARWVFFFFSSRRRHTRCSRDWSSDECSSDLCKSPVGPNWQPQSCRGVLNGRFMVGIQRD